MCILTDSTRTDQICCCLYGNTSIILDFSRYFSFFLLLLDLVIIYTFMVCNFQQEFETSVDHCTLYITKSLARPLLEWVLHKASHLVIYCESVYWGILCLLHLLPLHTGPLRKSRIPDLRGFQRPSRGVGCWSLTIWSWSSDQWPLSALVQSQLLRL